MNEHSVPRTCSKERRQLVPELAFWSKFASACAVHVLIYYRYVVHISTLPALFVLLLRTWTAHVLYSKNLPEKAGVQNIFLSPPEGGLGLVTNRQGAGTFLPT